MSFVYSVKFICGTQNPSTTCTPVRQGVYSREINIHNFHQPGGPAAHIQKRILLLVNNNHPDGLEPNPVAARLFAN